MFLLLKDTENVIASVAKQSLFLTKLVKVITTKLLGFFEMKYF